MLPGVGSPRTPEMSIERPTRVLLAQDGSSASPLAEYAVGGFESVVDRASSLADAVAMLTRKPSAYGTVVIDVGPGAQWGIGAVETVAEAAGRAALVVLDGGRDTAIRSFAEIWADHYVPRTDWAMPAVPRGDLVGADALSQLSSSVSSHLMGDMYRTIVETTLDGLWMIDLFGRILYANPRMAEMLGYEVEDLEGSPAHDFVSPTHSSMLDVELVRRRFGLSSQYELCLLTSDGDERWMLASARPLLDENDLPIAAFTDISERRKLERQLLQAKKMEAIGHLAGGVAHDFNNLLTLIGGYATLLRRRFDEDDAGHEDVVEIEKAVEQASSLTRQLLAFGRQTTPDVRRLDVNAVIADIRTMLSRLVTEDIALITRLEADPAEIVIDAGQLEQIVTNLCVNARDAMPDGGTIVIETETVDVSYRAADMLGSGGAGPHVRLTVSDTGMGMDEKTRSQIFDPFFTTKEPGQGTGLGLATVYGIVDQNDGLISVYSELGEGTTVRINLPLAQGGVSMAADDTHDTQQREPEKTTALLVEDNDGVRAFSRRVLTGAGYDVLEAGVPSEALVHADRHGPSIDLLITDIVMPEMNGKVLVQQIAEQLPDLPVIYVSGFAEGKIAHEGDLLKRSLFVSKPFSPEELLDAASTLLDGHERSAATALKEPV